MKLPNDLCDKTEWALIGPMGPEAPDFLRSLPLLAVDGGGRYVAAPDVWIGDGDSYSAPPPGKVSFKLSPQKDSSDLASALELLSQTLSYKLHLWGFLGGRKDHELFVLGECSRFLEHHSQSQIWLYGNNRRVEFEFYGAGQWDLNHQGLFSMGCLNQTMVQLIGDVHYPLTEPLALEPLSSLGLSNQASGNFTLKNLAPVFIYFPEGR